MSNTQDRARLQRLLGGPELAELRRRLRARFERGDPGTSFTLAGLTPAQRRALEGLTGRSLRMANSMRLTLPELDAVLTRAGLAASLREALEILDGPILDLKAQRQALEEAWEQLGGTIQEPRLLSFLAAPGALTLVKRLSGDPASAQQLLTRAECVLARLPARGIPLAQLAAETQGDAHALDPGMPLATLVLRAAPVIAAPAAPGPECVELYDVERRDIEGREDTEDGLQEGPREQWARLGVTVNELSAPVLCLNLPVQDGVLSPGEPVHLSLRTLLRAPPSWSHADRDVFVCENPSIVTVAADRLGKSCAPLMCTDGMPRTAQRTLMTQLRSAGARLRYHGDFDWPGLTIANLVLRRLGALPWRLRAEDYEAACRAGGLPLLGSRVEASWEPRLAQAMQHAGIAVHEEAVVESLLEELGAS